MKRDLSNRIHPRLKNYDYGSEGAYYITICTYNRRCLLSQIVGRGLAPAEVRLTEYGCIIKKQLFLLENRFPNLKIDYYVIMPNHIHAIFVLGTPTEDDRRSTLMDAVCAFKSLSVRECKKIGLSEKLFQTSFHDHVIRGKEDYDEIAEYIINNPLKWELDKLYMRDD